MDQKTRDAFRKKLTRLRNAALWPDFQASSAKSMKVWSTFIDFALTV
jgi:hypothetical protein